MNSQDTYSLAFTREELCLLSALLGGAFVVGVEDPFLGLLTEEVEGRLEQARQSLTEQDYLEVRADGEVVVDAAAAAIVQTAAKPDWTLAVSRSDADGRSVVCLIHKAGDMIVEQEAMPNGQVVLTAVRDLDTAARRVKAFVDLSESPWAPGPAFRLSEDVLDKVRQLAREEGEAAACSSLEQAGVPSVAARALSSAFGKDGNHGSLLILAGESGRMDTVESLAWLIGSQGAWFVQPCGEGESQSLLFTPASVDEIHGCLTTALLGKH